MSKDARSPNRWVFDVLLALFPLALILVALVEAASPKAGGLERVAYTPNSEHFSFSQYLPYVCYYLILPTYYAFRRMKVLVSILIGLLLIMCLQILWRGQG